MKRRRVCKVEGCDNKYRCSGYCEKHYQQFRRKGKTVDDVDLWNRNNPSKFIVVDKVCFLELYNKKGKVTGEASIDTEDYEKIEQYRFYQSKPDKKKPYVVVKNNKGKKLHHLIVGKPPKGLYTDHKNRNTLDNRKCNLRFITPSQSGMNRTRYKGKTSEYKGVHWDKSRKKWKVEIKLNRVCRHIGRFDDEIEAATAYDIEAIRLFGTEFAVLNTDRRIELLLTALRLDIEYVKRNLS